MGERVLKWGRCRVSPQRVYWVVYAQTSRDDHEETILADGYADTIPTAEAEALEAVGQVREGYEKVWPGSSGNAARMLRSKTGERREPVEVDPAREYLYTYHDPGPRAKKGRDPYWLAHPILRRTPKRVWVDPVGCRLEDVGTERETEQGRPHEGRPPISLDREKLDSVGHVYSQRRYSRSSFYIRPELGLRLTSLGSETIDALAVLGLRWPCTSAQLKDAYRRRSRETHPDVGGSPEEFCRVNEAYERAAKYV